MKTIDVIYENRKYTYPHGISLIDMCKDFQKDFEYPILVAKVNGVSTPLDMKLSESCFVEFFDRTSKKGSRAYERTAIFILAHAAKDVTGNEIKVEHSMDKGIYCKCDDINAEKIELIKNRMMEIVAKDYPVEKLTVNRLRLINYIEKTSAPEKADIFKYTIAPFINIYKMNGMYDCLYGECTLSTKYINDFNLEYVSDDGFMLMLPFMYDNQKISSYVHHKQFFDTIMKFINWTEKVGVRNFSELNKKISDSKIDDLVFMNEAHFNRNLLNIAETISKNKDIKLVLIGGPSCSGKTTTSKKLELFLKSLGLEPLAISTDDYFLERSETPVDENGKRDYETVEALDKELFNNQLKELVSGNEVLMPTFNFITGKKEYNKRIKLPDNGILIIEGLHTLNDDLTSKIENKNKFKIYISPLTALNIDEHTRLNSTDNRLLRRMVRDNRVRGYTASDTLESWERVRTGETKYVFPYQDKADVILNTVLVYEMSILKLYAEPLLYSVKYDDPNYGEAVRLLTILNLLLPMPSDDIPKDSILREFIGGSCFE